MRRAGILLTLFALWIALPVYLLATNLSSADVVAALGFALVFVTMVLVKFWENEDL